MPSTLLSVCKWRGVQAHLQPQGSSVQLPPSAQHHSPQVPFICVLGFQPITDVSDWSPGDCFPCYSLSNRTQPFIQHLHEVWRIVIWSWHIGGGWRDRSALKGIVALAEEPGFVPSTQWWLQWMPGDPTSSLCRLRAHTQHTYIHTGKAHNTII